MALNGHPTVTNTTLLKLTDVLGIKIPVDFLEFH
jgi:hypothetical protein